MSVELRYLIQHNKIDAERVKTYARLNDLTVFEAKDELVIFQNQFYSTDFSK